MGYLRKGRQWVANQSNELLGTVKFRRTRLTIMRPTIEDLVASVWAGEVKAKEGCRRLLGILQWVLSETMPADGEKIRYLLDLHGSPDVQVAIVPDQHRAPASLARLRWDLAVPAVASILTLGELVNLYGLNWPPMKVLLCMESGVLGLATGFYVGIAQAVKQAAMIEQYIAREREYLRKIDARAARLEMQVNHYLRGIPKFKQRP